MKITKQKIEKLHKLTDEVKHFEFIASENLKTAKDRHGNNRVKLERNGKKIELAEKILWEEVFHLGEDSQAGKILKKKYKKVFNLYEKQKDKVKELKNFITKEFGIDFTKITVSDYVKLTEAIIEYKLDK